MKKFFTFSRLAAVLLTMMMVQMLSVSAWATTTKKIGKFYYELDEETKEATLIQKPGTESYSDVSYNISGAIVIPGTVKYNSETYTVKSIGYMAFINSGVTSVKVEEGVEFVDNFAFMSCGQLTSITLPSTITHFGNQVFMGANSLKSFTIYAKTPPAFDYGSPFADMDTKSIESVNVPYESMDAYRDDPNWGIFADVIQAAKGSAPASITWGEKELKKVYLFLTGTQTINYVTVTAETPDMDKDYCHFMYDDKNDINYTSFSLFYNSSLTFSSTLGNIKRIVITCIDATTSHIAPNSGWQWVEELNQLVWSGDPASEVVLTTDGSGENVSSGPISSIEYIFEGAPASEPITWDKADVSSISILSMSDDYYQDATVKDITVTAYSPTENDYAGFYYFEEYDNSTIAIHDNGVLTFSHPIDNLKAIDIICNPEGDIKEMEHLAAGSGWKWNSRKQQLQWTGDAAAVDLTCDGSADGIHLPFIQSIVFYFADKEVPASVTWEESDMNFYINWDNGWSNHGEETVKDVTVTTYGGETDYCQFGYSSLDGYSSIRMTGAGARIGFTSDIANFKRIVITSQKEEFQDLGSLDRTTGWTFDVTNNQLIWQGDAAWVDLACDGSSSLDLSHLTSIVFYFEGESAPATETSTFTWSQRHVNLVSLYTNSSQPTDTTALINNIIVSSNAKYGNGCSFDSGWLDLDFDSELTFHSIVGDITGIVITISSLQQIGINNTTWTYDDEKLTLTWSGDASSDVTLPGHLDCRIASIDFTYQPAAAPRKGEGFSDDNNFEYEITGAHTAKMVGQSNLGTIPASVVLDGEIYYITEIEDYAFSGITQMGNIYGGENIAKIGDHAFDGCLRLGTVSLDSKVLESIGNEAFKNCKLLSLFTCSTQLPPVLGSDAFAGDNMLNHIHVYSHVVETYQAAAGWSTYADKIGALYSAPAIGEQFFAYTSKTANMFAVFNLTPTKEVKVMPYNAEVNAIYPVTRVGTLTIPESTFYMYYNYTVTAIGEKAYKDSTRIKVVVIPEQIRFIEADAFKNCTGVEKVYFTWDDPRTITWADAEVGADFKTAAYGGTRIIVPEGKLRAYQEWAPAWAKRMTEGDITDLPKEAPLLTDTSYFYYSTTRSAITCTLDDGTKLFFNKDMKTNYDASGYFYLSLNRIETDAKTLNIPSEYEYHGQVTSIKRILIGSGDYRCDQLQQLIVPEGTEVINLPYAYALKTLNLPATTVCFNLSSSSKFKDLYLQSVYPPYWGTVSATGGLNAPTSQDLTNVTVHVPAMAMDLYANSAPYTKAQLVASEQPVEHLFVGYEPDVTIQSTDNLAEKAQLTVPRWYAVAAEKNAAGADTYGLFHNTETAFEEKSTTTSYGNQKYFYPAQLTVNADKELALGKFKLEQDCGEYYFPNYTDPNNGASYKITPSTAIFNSPVTAEEVEMTYHLFRSHLPWKGNVAGNTELGNYKYYVVSFPFDVKISDITFPDLQSSMEVICMEFDGAKRATAAASNYWRLLAGDEILHANQGYLIAFVGKQTSGYTTNYIEQTTLQLKAMDTDSKQQIFSNSDVAIALTPYPSEYKQREGWNLIGNPYPCFFDIKYLDWEAPVTVYDGFDYYAFSPIDDEYYLYPNEAIFVQCSDENASVNFRKEGRLHNDPKGLWQLSSSPAPARMMHRASASERSVYNFILSGESGYDRTRIVINEQASTAYETTRDAAKMLGQGGKPQLYVLDGGVQYAINERPLEQGVFSLGMIFPVTGSYVLSLQDNPDEQMTVMLTDHLTGTELDITETAYTFDAAAGSTTNRFSLRIGRRIVNATENINAETGETVYYDLQGRMFRSLPTQSGVYILKQGTATHKVIVK